jgi:hypothetical protein
MTRNATRFVSLLVTLVLAGAANAVAGVTGSTLSYDVANGNYTEITGGTVLASGTGIEGYYGGVTLPFNLAWDGGVVNTVYVSSDGYVSFDPNASGSIGSSGVAAWANYLTGTATGELSYKTLGTSPNRVFVVQWKNVTRAPSTSSNDVYNFQIRLVENGGYAEVVYGSMTLTAAMGAQIGATWPSSDDIYLVVDYYNNIWINPAVSMSAQESRALEGWGPASGLTYTFGSIGNIDAGVIGVANPSGKFNANTSMMIQATIRNWGATALDSVVINWKINATTRTPVSYYPQPALQPGEEATVNLGTANFTAGSFNTLIVWTSAPDGGGDVNPGNDAHIRYLAPRVQGNLNLAMSGNNGIFTSFRDVFRHLYSSGISGNTTVRVFNGNWDEQIIVPTINANPSNSIVTIASAPSNAPVIVWRPSFYPWSMYGAFDSDHAQATVLDGASVNFSNLKFMLENGLNWGSHIYAPNSSRLGVDMCNLQGPNNFLSATDPSYSISVYSGTNTITNNTVNNMRYGLNIQSWGTVSTVTNNVVTNCAEQGIYNYSSNMTVDGNEVSGAAGASNFTGITIEGAGRVSNNLVWGDVSVAQNSQSTGMFAYSYNGTGGSNGLTIFNNMISVAATGGTFGFYVYTDASLATTKLYHNSVNVTGSAAPNSSALWLVGYTAAEVINNIFQNYGNGNNGGFAVFAENYSATNTYSVADFNNLMTTGPNIGVYGGTTYVRNAVGNPLTSWRTGTGKDLNSSSVSVNFIGGADLHLMTIQQQLWGSSALLAAVPTDIDGEIRTKPYMGADEIKPSIRILQNPESRYACLGESFTLITVAEVTDGATITYQWYKDGVELTGQTGAILSFGSIGYGSSGVYTCLVKANDGTNFVEVMSEPAVIIVVRQTSITQQPASQPVALGGTAILQVSAEAIGAPTDFVPSYQWKKRYWSTTANAYLDSNVVDNGRITGAQSSTLTIRNVMSVDTMDSYVCEVAGYCGTAISKSARLFIPIVALSNNTPNACEGGIIQIECAVFPSAVPGSAVYFEWFRDGNKLFDGGDISGATTKVLTVANVTSADAGEYHAEVTWDGVDVTISSDTIDVTLSVPPTVATQPVGDTLCEGQTLTLTASGTGSNLLHQWFKDSTAIPGARAQQYTVNAVTAADAGTYYARITNACGDVLTDAVDVVVNTPPSITEDPSDVALYDDETLTLTVTASGSGPLEYQWYKNDTAIAGATSSTYTKTPTTGGDQGSYSVVVSNECGSDSSDAAVVNITTGIAGGDVLLNGFMLGSAVPNPTTDAVAFTVVVPAAQNVTVTLTDMLGNQVATLLNGFVNEGATPVRFSASAFNLAPGVYTYTFVAKGFVAAQQFVFVR